MLQCLHKLHIQEECQSKTGCALRICFPRQKKVGDKKYQQLSVDTYFKSKNVLHFEKKKQRKELREA